MTLPSTYYRTCVDLGYRSDGVYDVAIHESRAEAVEFASALSLLARRIAYALAHEHGLTAARLHGQLYELVAGPARDAVDKALGNSPANSAANSAASIVPAPDTIAGAWLSITVRRANRDPDTGHIWDSEQDADRTVFERLNPFGKPIPEPLPEPTRREKEVVPQ